MRIAMGYPRLADELNVLRAQRTQHPIAALAALTTAAEIQALQPIVAQVYVDPVIDEYVLTIGRNTRRHDDITLGASTRALLTLVRIAQAYALLAGRDYVVPDDVRQCAVAVIAHRIMLGSGARLRGASPEHIIRDLVEAVPLPTQRTTRRPER
jgi:MoxR-like ATPase